MIGTFDAVFVLIKNAANILHGDIFRFSIGQANRGRCRYDRASGDGSGYVLRK